MRKVPHRLCALLLSLLLLLPLASCQSQTADPVPPPDVPFRTVTWKEKDGRLNKQGTAVLDTLLSWMEKEQFDGSGSYVAAAKKYIYNGKPASYGGTIFEGETLYSHSTQNGPCATADYHDLTKDERYSYISRKFQTTAALEGLMLPGGIDFGASPEAAFQALGLEFNPDTDFRADKGSDVIMTLLTTSTACLTWNCEENTASFNRIVNTVDDQGLNHANELRMVLTFKKGSLSSFSVSSLIYDELPAPAVTTAAPQGTESPV